MKTRTVHFNADNVCVPGGDSRAGLAKWELYMAREEGRGGADLERLAGRSQTKDEAVLLDVYAQALSLPENPDLASREPDDLESIRKLRPKAKRRMFEVPRGDELHAVMAWKGGSHLSALAGRPVRLRFRMQEADLFAMRFAV